MLGALHTFASLPLSNFWGPGEVPGMRYVLGRGRKWMQKIEGSNSWWHHGYMPVGTLHSLEKQQAPTARSVLWFGFGRGQCWWPTFYLRFDLSQFMLTFPSWTSSLLYSKSCWNVSKRRLWGLFEGGCISHILKEFFKAALSEEGDRVKDGNLGWPESPCDLAASERGALEKRWESLWKTYQNINCHPG